MSETYYQPFPHTAVQCLSAVAHHHGLSLDPARLIHDYALEAEEPSLERLARMAEENGLKAKVDRLQWAELASLQGVFPVMARLGNGNFVIVVGVRREEGAPRQVAIVDPLADRATVMMVDADAFSQRWSGEVLMLKRVYALGDPNQPFGLRWFIPEILRHGRVFRDIALAVVILTLLALATPIFFQLIIDKVLVHQSFSTLYVLTFGICVALCFEAAFSFLRQYLLLGVTNKIDMRLVRRTFAHLLALPIQFAETMPSGVIVRHMQQAEKIRQFLTGKLFLTLLDATGLFLFVPLLFMYSFKLGMVVLAFTLAIATVVVLLIKPFQQRLKDLYNAEGERQGMLVEAIHGMRTIKALALEPVQRRQWEQKAATAIGMHFRVGQISITAHSLTSLLEKLMMVAVIAIGAGDVFSQTMTVGALIAFQMISGRVVGPLVQMVSLVHEYQETALSVQMLGEIMNRPPEGRGGGGGLRPQLQGLIEFDNVTFRYPGASVAALDRLTIVFPAGKIVGIVGKSGSGKTTLTRLIQSMYPVTEGVIRVDGVDIRELDLGHLRRNIGVVLQENFIFRGTVRDNIAAAKPDASFEQVVVAAQTAGADEFIERLPQGYDTPLEENGANLSGGQKQRLAIARAILTQPRILILDEAASALDPESETIFIRNLGRLAVGRTVIIVSHRLSTLINADAIVVLSRGAIADIGRHRDLLQRCQDYQQLWNQQNSHL